MLVHKDDVVREVVDGFLHIGSYDDMEGGEGKVRSDSTSDGTIRIVMLLAMDGHQQEGGGVGFFGIARIDIGVGEDGNDVTRRTEAFVELEGRDQTEGNVAALFF